MKHCRIETTVGFWLFLCVFYYFDPSESFFPFLLSVGSHELGHISALCLTQTKIHSLRLTASGVILETDPLPYRRELIVALAGPTVNLTLLYFTAKKYPLFALVNLCLLLYNSLPIYPLDGGRVLRATLHLLLAERIARGLEAAICTLCFVSILSISVYLTCVWHAGLWPTLLSSVLLYRILETNRPRIRNTS